MSALGHSGHSIHHIKCEGPAIAGPSGGSAPGGFEPDPWFVVRTTNQAYCKSITCDARPCRNAAKRRRKKRNAAEGSYILATSLQQSSSPGPSSSYMSVAVAHPT
jgi:hypothetical protein